MLNQRKLIGYHAGETFLHGLSGASKMLFFVLVSVAAMISYDTRFLLGLALLSLCLFRLPRRYRHHTEAQKDRPSLS